MTLRRKTLLVVTLTLVALVVLLYLLLRTLLMGSFNTLEEQVSLRDLSRAETSFQDQSASMARAIHDWSTWDETYRFVQGDNPAFIASNLSDSTFSSVDVNLMLFVNNANEIVYSKAVALEADWPSTLLTRFETYARGNADFFRLMSSVPTDGLVVVDGLPILVASRPILRSDESGPRAGTLIWGRYVGPQELLELSQTLQLSIDLRRLDMPTLSAEDQAAETALLNTKPRTIIPADENTLHGYTLLNDIYGQPVLLLKTTQDRAIYTQGQASLNYFMAALAVVGIVFAVVVLLLLERLMLAPLSHLSTHVRQIGVHDDFSMRLPVTGHDEFTQLASTLNRMLNLVAQSRAVLQRERNLLRLLIDTVPANVYIKDVDSRFVEANLETALQMGVKTANDLVGKTDLDFFSADLAGKYLADEQAILQSGQPLRNIEESNFDQRTQEKSWFLTTKVPILDEHGQVTGLVGVGLDITERKQVQEQIARERDLLRTLIDHLPDYIFVKDADGRFVNSNAAHNRVAQVKDADELRGKLAGEVFPQPLAAQFEADDQRVLHTGQALVNIERTTVDAQGQKRTVLTTKIPLRDVSGKVTGLVGISRDITERERIEQALEEERTLLRTLIDAMPDYVYIKDRESRFVIGNKAIALSLGAASPEAIVGKTDFDYHAPDLAAGFFAEEQALLQSGTPLLNQEEIVIDQRTGEQQILLATTVPIFDSHGQITGLVGVSRDITERKQAEEQAFALVTEQQRSKLMREFITDVSHDFRTPLTIIGTSAFLVAKTTDPAKLTQYSQRIEEQMSRLRLLLDNFVELAHLDEQASSLPYQSTDLDALVKAVLELSQPEVTEKHQKLEYHSEIGSALVLGDSAALSQAITQVVVNALNFTPSEGKITLRLYREGEEAVLEVADTGIGIPAADLPHIFESFYRVDSARSMTTGGAGLGLSIAKRIVELLKGRISVASEFGVGSVFKIYLPIYQ